MLDLNQIGKTIMYYRELNDMTQLDLADQLYITRQLISKWETGKSVPNIEMMVQLTNLFHISIDDLLFGHKTFEQNDFMYLLNHYPRNYVINRFIKGEIYHSLKEVLYLLNTEERALIIRHIIKGNLVIQLNELLPLLCPLERIRIIKAFKDQILGFRHLLTMDEQKLLEENK